MTTRKLSQYFDKEVKETVRWSLPSGNEPASFSSVYFDGNGDYLSSTHASAFALNGIDFTIDFWMYPTAYVASFNASFPLNTLAAGNGWYVAVIGTSTTYTDLQFIAYSSNTATVGIGYTARFFTNRWYHIAVTKSGSTYSLFVNGELVSQVWNNASWTDSTTLYTASYDGLNYNYTGYLSNVRIVKGIALYDKSFQVPIKPTEATTQTSFLTCSDLTIKDRSVNNISITTSGNAAVAQFSPFTSNFTKMLSEGVNGGNLFSNSIVSTYSLVYTSGINKYAGGVLAPNGDIHFVQARGNITIGQKISANGIVSTYNLIFVQDIELYSGGVLSTNGDIHFIPLYSNIGQKISANGIVSTYTLVYTANGIMKYFGGVLAPNGDIHFVPFNANRGQKISAAGVVSTYSLAYTTTSAYKGGVLTTNGDIHFVPCSAARGQKLSAGVVSTYSLIYTNANGAYVGGALAPNGDIHFVPFNANLGQKISSTGVVSTYSLVYTTTFAYAGGVLAPNGDIHFIPYSAAVGQKVSASGVVSTYSLVYTGSNAYSGGVLAPNGDIHFVPYYGTVGQKLTLNTGVNFSKGVCMSPFFNKF